MPFKLIEPDPVRRQSNFRVRGTEFKQHIDRSTGTSNRKEAQRILIAWRERAMGGALIVTDGPTFAGAALSYMRKGGERQHLAALLKRFGDTPLVKIDQATIDAVALELFPDHSPATRNRAVYTPISAIMRHAGHSLVLRRPKGAWGRSRKHWLQPEEAETLLEAAKIVSPRFGAFCTFLLYTGCRLGEAVNLTPADLHLDEGFAYVSETKNGHPRLVHLPPHVVEALTGLPSYPKTVFGLGNRQVAREQLLAAFKHAGIKKPDGVAFHLFRHTYGAWMRRYAGLDTSGLVATGAWKSHAAASVYEHVDATDSARRADLLPTFGAAAGGHRVGKKITY